MKTKSRKSRALKAEIESLLGETNVEVWWQPLGRDYEMMGRSGGWFYRSAERSIEPLGHDFNQAMIAIQQEADLEWGYIG
jgi:hypothetical protein